MAASETESVPYARLIPANDAARLAFHEVAVLVKQGVAEHHAKYMQIESTKIRIINPSRHDYSRDTDTETTTEVNTDSDHTASSHSAPLYWTGFFKLSLSEPPSSVGAGWRVGRGKKFEGKSSSGNIDIRLCTDSKFDVRGLHWRFTHDRKTGVLHTVADHGEADAMIVGEKMIWKSKKLVPGDKRHIAPLNKARTFIKVGQLAYSFEFHQPETLQDAERMQLEVKKFFRINLDAEAPPSSTSATPRHTDVSIGEWTIRTDILGRGSAGQVVAAIRDDGSVVAVKIMSRKSTDECKMCDTEVRVADQLARVCKVRPVLGSQRLVQLHRVLYERGSATWDQRGAERIYMLLAPLARMTLQDVLNENFFDSWETGNAANFRLSIFKQVLEGLAFLHSQRWMHRDIKPRNIGVVSSEPPRAVLLDLGSACQFQPGTRLDARPGRIGTVSHLSPEFEDTSRGYSQSADVWSLGVCGHELFRNSHPYLGLRRNVNPWRWPDTIQDAKSHLNSSVRQLSKTLVSIDNLIERMLRWEPNESNASVRRITAADALVHPSLYSIETISDNEESRRRPIA